MRKILTFVAVLALAGCGGGGGGSAPAPTPQQPQTPVQQQGNLVTPQFVLKIPQRTNSKARTPQYVSSATLSVVITLTADSVGITPSSISGNPATTTVSAGQCSTSCTVNGPPTPPGTDSFTVVTYDNANPAGAHALNAGQLNNVTINAGVSNVETLTLGAIPATLTLSNVPTNVFNAGSQNQTDFVSVIATDGAGQTIPTGQSPAVTYVDATGAPLVVKISDPDTNVYGTCIEPAPGSTACTTGSPTFVTLNGPDAGATVRYDGLAENPVTITASASTATSNSASIQPNLNAPAFNSAQATPSGVALSGSAEIDLFAPSGIGSTGSESFTESGWTNSPYGHALNVSVPAGCASIATASAGTNDTTAGTPITATVVAGPVAGSCTMTVADGLTGNSTDGSASLLVTYTTSSVNANAKHRRN